MWLIMIPSIAIFADLMSCVFRRVIMNQRIVRVEALSRGVPIVFTQPRCVSRIDCTVQWVLLFDPAQPGSLVDTLGVLLHDASLRRELGSAGQHAVQTHYNINQAANMTRAVYQL